MACFLKTGFKVHNALIKSCLTSRNKYVNSSSFRFLYNTRILLGIKGTEVKMPSLSPTMTEGTIVKWLKNEGESIQPGDAICEIQTDKAVVGFEMEEEGVLAKILVPEDTKDIKIGTLIALICEEGENWKDVDVPEQAAAVEQKPTITEDSPPIIKAPQVVSSQTTPPSGSKPSSRLGPAVKLLLRKHSLEASKLSATGPFNTLLKEDVLNHVSHSPSQPSVTKPKPTTTQAPYIDIELTSMRRTIAKRLTESKTTIPHGYQSVESNIDLITKYRKKLQEDGVKVSMNDFIIKAVAGVLQVMPQVNAIWDGQKPQYLSNVDISVAVATENGLITPIVKNANTLGVQQISNNVKELANRARQGKLKLDEFQGGSFSISNLGMFGIKEFSAVINPPQAAILAVGGSRSLVSLDNSPITTMVTTLCYDARIIDDTTAAEFLSLLKEYLENPIVMLIGSPIKQFLTLSN